MLDFITMHQKLWDGRPPAMPVIGEFVVIDQERGEIGYFEEWGAKPALDVQKVHSMIEGHFGCRALRIFDRVWVV